MSLTKYKKIDEIKGFDSDFPKNATWIWSISHAKILHSKMDFSAILVCKINKT